MTDVSQGKSSVINMSGGYSTEVSQRRRHSTCSNKYNKQIK